VASRLDRQRIHNLQDRLRLRRSSVARLKRLSIVEVREWIELLQQGYDPTAPSELEELLGITPVRS